MKTIIKSHYFIYILTITGLLLGSCYSNTPEVAIEPRVIDSPEYLDDTLAKKRIFFNKFEDGNSTVHITNLGHSDFVTFDLQLPGNDIVLSPEARYVAFTSLTKEENQFKSSLWLHEIKTNQETRIAGLTGDIFTVSYDSPNFSWDEREILYFTTWYDREELNLVLKDISTNNKTILATNQNLISSPMFSPDGKYIIATCGGFDHDSGKPGFQICIMDSDGTNQELLTHNGDSHGSYTFTPDSQRVVYTEWETGGLINLFEKPYHRIYSVAVDGSDRNMLMDFRGGIKGISDDGQDIILEGRPTEDHPYSIYILGIDGTNLRLLTYFDDFLAEWYPDDEK